MKTQHCYLIPRPYLHFSNLNNHLNTISIVNNSNTRKWCEICSKLTIKTPEQRHEVNNKNTITTSLTSFWCFYG